MLRTTSLRLWSVMAAAVLAAGCGVEAKTYVMTKKRVGVDYEGGNAGYVVGKPLYEDPDKKTRKVYVLELTKPIPESEVKKIKEETVTQAQVPVEQVPVRQQSPGPLVITPQTGNGATEIEYTKPLVPDEPGGTAAPVSASQSGAAGGVSYTVVKDDTLQKISKKFYNSYGKWMKIYDANKDKIKNPNFVKPGTVLTIPPADN